MSDKVVYPVYGGDDIPYEPSYLRMVFESREDDIKYIKELQEKEEDLADEEDKYYNEESDWMSWYYSSHDTDFCELEEDTEEYNNAVEEIIKHFNITRDYFQEVINRPYYTRQCYHIGPKIPFFPQKD